MFKLQKKGKDAGQLRWLWLSLLVFVLDLWTKDYAVSHLTYAQPVQVTSFFNWTLMHNYGAAFSLLDNAQMVWQLILLSVIAFIVSVFSIVWLSRMPCKKHSLLASSLALIVGGALGNFIDRIMNGYVIDFISIHYHNWYWPTFNVADMSICVGAFLFVLASLTKR